MQGLNKYGLLMAILLLTFAAYYNSLSHDFTRLDDHVQVVENPNIRSLSVKNIQAIFSSTSVGMYQPLTTLFYALTYQVDGLNPKNYHLLSLFIHLLNVILLFRILSTFRLRQDLIYLLTAIFSLHPMQVESIVWVSAFSNLLYSCFFLLSISQYRSFQKNKNQTKYLYCLLLFIPAVLAKSSSITLPLVLLALDYFENQKISRKDRLNKLPFLALALVIGLVTIYSRESAGHLSDLSVQFGWFDRIFLVAYSVLFYPFKFLFPIELSVFYPYPEVDDGFLPLHFYLSLPTLAVFLWLLFKHRSNQLLILGSLFYLFSISLVLQIIPVGNQLNTDRYIYLPMIGLLLVLAAVIQKIKLKAQLVFAFAAILSVFLFLGSKERAEVWASDGLIWKDVIEKHPKVAQAYNNLGSYQLSLGEDQAAFENFNRAIELKPYYADALSNRGNLYSGMGESQKALTDFNRAIELRPHADAYFNRANEKVRLKQLPSATEDYARSIALKPSADTYTNWAYALLQMGETKAAKNKLKAAIELNPNYAQAYFLRGMIAQRSGELPQSCEYFRKAAALKHSQAQQALQQFCR